MSAPIGHGPASSAPRHLARAPMQPFGPRSLLPGVTASPKELAVLGSVEPCLVEGKALTRWYLQRHPHFARTFELLHHGTRPFSAKSFFDQVELSEGLVPVMGSTCDYEFDHARGHHTRHRGGHLERWRAQLSAFVLHYFMRISKFTLPEPKLNTGPSKLPLPLRFLSWCAGAAQPELGFGFEQLFYKRRDNGLVGRFEGAERWRIVDVEALEEQYEWIVGRVQILNFDLHFPGDVSLPRFALPLDEHQYFAIDSFFTRNVVNPSPGIAGSYGFGYAFIQDPGSPTMLAYGPGRFDVGFQLFNFDLHDDGRVCVQMPFAANRPTKILEIPLDPLAWAARLGAVLAGERTPNWISALESELKFGPSFDPVHNFIALANLMTLGEAGRRLCISKEQLEKLFLVYHAHKFFTLITGAFVTWRQIPDWTDANALPRWVREGAPV